MDKKVIPELFVLRCAACLSIVLLHALARVYGENEQAVNYMSLLLTFGTPVFVFISEFIISYSYPKKQSGQFWSKRLKFILLPYVIFGAFYALVKAFEVSSAKGIEYSAAAVQLLWRHILLADYHGYFIIVIFQFYLLHSLFVKTIEPRYSPKTVIGVSLLIQLLYLGFFNFVPAPSSSAGAYIWNKFYWVPFLGWLSYFSIAFYCGKYYGEMKSWLLLRWKWVVWLPVPAAILPVVLYGMGVNEQIISKRVDMVPFVIAMIGFLFALSLKMRSVPRWIVLVSQYSFGMYLFHPFYMAVMKKAEPMIPITIHPLLLVSLYFICGAVLSALTVSLVNLTKIGPYLVGKIGIGMNKQDTDKRSTAARPRVNEA
ncbi:acyltransferase family protein [Paenibacillus contaminans]|uniref:acyltransferase family protein n=1 Tax=Paenibacillus contaminans TaxID=450362 RepID=UPI001313FA5B|nr:acyltransferase family protein [Paenibacillus contaminans]